MAAKMKVKTHLQAHASTLIQYLAHQARYRVRTVGCQRAGECTILRRVLRASTTSIVAVQAARLG